MKEPTVVGNCRPKMQRNCPRERMARDAEERAQRSSGVHYTSQAPLVQPISRTGPDKNIPPIPASTSINMNRFSKPPAQSLIRTASGKTVSWSTKAPFTMSIDSDGRHIRFSHCPGLTFPSMQYAFDYFHVQAKLHDQRVIEAARQQQLQRLRAAQHGFQVAQKRLQAEQQGYLAEHLGFQAGQLADFAAQQAFLAEALCPFKPVWQLDTPLKPIDTQTITNLRTPPCQAVSGSPYQHATEPSTGNQWREQDPVPTSSRSSPPEYPPQTLFAESTPHAQEIQARPQLRIPVKGLSSWSFHSKMAKDDTFPQSFPSIQVSDQETTLPGSRHRRSACIDTVFPQPLTNEVETSDQPAILRSWHPLPSSYADTVLPQTLNKKDRRVLGVSLSAGINEIRAAFWLRDFQYNTDRYRAASLEERAVAALKLNRAQEAVERLCGSSGE